MAASAISHVFTAVAGEAGRPNKFTDDAVTQFEQRRAEIRGEIEPLSPRRENEALLPVLEKCPLHLLGELNLDAKQLLNPLPVELGFSRLCRGPLQHCLFLLRVGDRKGEAAFIFSHGRHQRKAEIEAREQC